MAGLLAHQLLAGSRQRAQFMDLRIGNEARLDQAIGGEIGDPHRVVQVGLTAGNRLDVRGVGEHICAFRETASCRETKQRTQQLILLRD